MALNQIYQIRSGVGGWIEDTSSPFFTTGDGNIGIGAHEPQHKLHVSGNAIISGYLYDSINSTGLSGYVLTSRQNGAQWNSVNTILSNITIEELNVTQITATTGIFNKINADNIDVSGNISVSGKLTASTGIFTSGVGIGTSNPTGLLHIVNNNIYENLFIVEDTGTPDPTPFVITKSGQVGIKQPNPKYDVHVGTGSLASFVVTSGGRIGVGTENPTGLFHILGDGSHEAYASGPNHLFIVEDSAHLDSTPFVITNAGAVGVGTTSPTTKLHISGSLRLNDGTEQNNYVLTSDANGNAVWKVAAAGGSPVEVQDESVSLTAGVTKINFSGAGVTATEPATDEILVNIPGGVTEAFVMFTR